jgi:hypothetical protein
MTGTCFEPNRVLPSKHLSLSMTSVGSTSRATSTKRPALRRHVPVLAAAVVAGVSDLKGLGQYRPEFVKGDEWYDGWANVWPDYERNSIEHYRN